MSKAGSKPGDVILVDEVKHYAVSYSDGGCKNCAFLGQGAGCALPVAHDCFGIYWLTKANYIIHRLKS